MAQRALAAGAKADERAAGLWVKGVAEFRLKKVDAARRTFTVLIGEFPDGDLTEGARRFIAMAAEEAGDLDAALEQYLVLQYDTDAAYFLDVLMTPEQIASFVEHHPDSPAHEMLLYSLGVRYMRAHRFDEARQAYARVRIGPTSMVPPWDEGGCRDDDGAYQLYGCISPKLPQDEKRWDVLPSWIMRDLKTMDEVEQLERRFGFASTDEERAEAMYQLGSYYYEASELTFYNPAAWRKGRFNALYYDHEMRSANDPQLFQRYMSEHEVLVRALDVYLGTARLYPRTRAARDALYTAAVIHERLSTFLLYWPQQYKEGIYASERMVTYDDVRRTYPTYPLPRGTYGWEPSTRTVNGDPAWDVPSKPQPLTGMERARIRIKRVERRIAQAWDLYGEVADGRLRRWTVAVLRWTLIGVVGVAILLVLGLTKRSRAVLFELIRRVAERRRESPKVVLTQASSYSVQEMHSAGSRAAAASRNVWNGFCEIMFDRAGRRALVLNILSHGALTVMVYAIVWAIN